MSNRAPSTGAVCADCGAELTPDEVRYYGHTCERCERRAMARLGAELDPPASASVVALHPDERPHSTRLGEELRRVMEEHIRRGNLTEAEVLGCITALLLDTWRLLRDLDED